MDVLNQFVASSDSESSDAAAPASKKRKTTDAGPPVGHSALGISFSLSAKSSAMHVPNASAYAKPVDVTQSGINAPLGDMHRPALGPQRPGKFVPAPLARVGDGKKAMLHPSGQVNTVGIDHHAFTEQFQSFQRHGYAANTCGDSRAVIGDVAAYRKGAQGKKKKKRSSNKGDKKTAAFDIDSYQGSWASVLDAEAIEAAAQKQEIIERPEGELEVKEARGWTGKFDVHSADFKKSKYVETTEFHGAQERDYQGRTYMEPAVGPAKYAPTKCHVPKKCVAEWKEHSKGVNVIRFVPNTGHLLASASMDTTVKIFDVHRGKKLLRTINAHELGVRDMNFTDDGRNFVTASFDKYVKYFDTETGQLVARYTTKKIPLCATLHHAKDGYVALVGQSDSNIVQWDLRQPDKDRAEEEEGEEPEPDITYAGHLGPVNSVCPVKGGDRHFFVSSSDDRKLGIWEFELNVMASEIIEDSMMSMPTMACHPKGRFLACNSIDNKVRVIQAKANKYTISRKKQFTGHLTSGVVCHLGFSPEGSMLISGDGEGRLFIWDWKSMKVLKRIKAHTKTCTSVAWNPMHQSMVATAGYDGVVKLWQ